MNVKNKNKLYIFISSFTLLTIVILFLYFKNNKIFRKENISDKTRIFFTTPIKSSYLGDIIWLPMGEDIVFEYKGNNLYSFNLPNKKLECLTYKKNILAIIDSYNKKNYFPDGRTILFEAFYKKNEFEYEKGKEILSIDLKTKSIKSLTPEKEWYNGYPEVSPDGEKILFIRMKKCNGKRWHSIWYMNKDGSEKKMVVPWTERNVLFCAYWKPDGKSFAYIRAPRSTRRWGIWKVDLTHNSSTKIIEGERIKAFLWITNNIIAFIMNEEIYLLEINNKKLMKLTSTSRERIKIGDFCYSSTAKLIAYESASEGKIPSIWLIRINGSKHSHLLDKDAWSLTFSPCGKKIAYCKKDGIWIAELNVEAIK